MLQDCTLRVYVCLRIAIEAGDGIARSNSALCVSVTTANHEHAFLKESYDCH